jgi:hypothetical protein
VIFYGPNKIEGRNCVEVQSHKPSLRNVVFALVVRMPPVPLVNIDS